MSYVLDTTPSEYNQYRLVTPATTLPVAVDSIKSLLRLDVADTSEDAFIGALIMSATDQVEKYLKRDLLTKTYTLYLDRFTGLIEIRRSPLRAITSIRYDNIDNVDTLLSAATYNIVYNNDFSNIQLAPTQVWPVLYNKRQAVRITFTAGYGIATDIPVAIQHAISLIALNMYENRGDCDEGGAADCGPCATGMPGMARGLLAPYRILDLNGRPMNGRF